MFVFCYITKKWTKKKHVVFLVFLIFVLDNMSEHKFTQMSQINTWSGPAMSLFTWVWGFLQKEHKYFVLLFEVFNIFSHLILYLLFIIKVGVDWISCLLLSSSI